MGTSLSGLTPATTFDGLLKTSDNDAITSSLKTIGSGDGTDSCLQLSNSALKINGGQATIVGVGNTSATTSLLVQNSAGSELLKVTDDGAIDFGVLGLDFSNDGSGGTMSVASDRYIKLASSLSTYSALSAHLFKTFDGSAYSEAMRITGNTNQFVGIGESTPTARLHIKGSGATSGTTALLVQNSAGSQLFKVSDNAQIDFNGNVYVNSDYKIIGRNAQNSIRYAAGELRLNIQGTASNHRYHIYDSSSATSFFEAFSQSKKIGINLNAESDTNVNAQLHIKGSGATAATTALLVENSAGTDLMSVTDDGKVKLGTSSSIVELNSGYNNRFQQNRLSFYSTDTNIRGINAGGQGLIVSKSTGTSDLYPTAILAVDSTTQGFLPPRMADSERDAITSPATGLMIYDTTNNQMNYFNGSNWVAF